MELGHKEGHKVRSRIQAWVGSGHKIGHMVVGSRVCAWVGFGHKVGLGHKVSHEVIRSRVQAWVGSGYKVGHKEGHRVWTLGMCRIRP